MELNTFRAHKVYHLIVLDYRKSLVSQLFIEDIVSYSLEQGYQSTGFRLSQKKIDNNTGQVQELHNLARQRELRALLE